MVVMMTIKIRVAQLNYCVGDLAGNAAKIAQAAHSAHRDGVKLLLTPELAICGYAAEDLFLRPSFVEACMAAVEGLALALASLKGLTVVVGHPMGDDVRTRSVSINRRFNAASVLRDGRTIHQYKKRELPNYQVFDERRYFSGGSDVCVFEVGDDGQSMKVGLLICEDAWHNGPALETAKAGAQMLAVINASPFHAGKGRERELAMQECTLATGGLPLVYAHLVGGQDEVVFEGGSFAVGTGGQIVGRAPSFQEDLFDVDVDVEANSPLLTLGAVIEPIRCPEADIWGALVLGVRDYIGKNGFPGAIIGLSGGIDSALVLAVAVDALGAKRVRAVMMPSPYTADMSVEDAREMAQRTSVQLDEISIIPEFEAFKHSLAAAFAATKEDTTEENLQARIRGTLLMALSNKFGAIVLTTGNKSEMATGYCISIAPPNRTSTCSKDAFKAHSRAAVRSLTSCQSMAIWQAKRVRPKAYIGELWARHEPRRGCPQA
jgi:NAD+ synthase (glutamine-hydrolysing)